MDFESLVGRINKVQDVLQAQAAHAVNLSLTARNWIVGYILNPSAKIAFQPADLVWFVAQKERAEVLMNYNPDQR